MTKDMNEYKGQARRLHKHLKEKLNDFAYSSSMEAVAALHGAANWRTLSGMSPAASTYDAHPDPDNMSEKELAQYLANVYAKGNLNGEHPDTSFSRGRWIGEVMAEETSLGYWTWLHQTLSTPERTTESEDDAKYLVSDGWSHLFGVGMPESLVRFVFDLEEHQITQMQIKGSLGWVPAIAIQMEDVEDSLINANPQAFDDPEDFDCYKTSTLPQWAEKM